MIYYEGKPLSTPVQVNISESQGVQGVRVVQTTGNSTTAVMSQKAVTDEISDLDSRAADIATRLNTLEGKTVSLTSLGINIDASNINKALSGYSSNDSVDERLGALEGNDSSINSRLSSLEGNTLLKISVGASVINCALNGYTATKDSIDKRLSALEARLAALEGGNGDTGGDDTTGGDENRVYFFAYEGISVDAEYVSSQEYTVQDTHTSGVINRYTEGTQYFYYIYPSAWGTCTFIHHNGFGTGVAYAFNTPYTIIINDVEYNVYRSKNALDWTDEPARIEIVQG